MPGLMAVFAICALLGFQVAPLPLEQRVEGQFVARGVDAHGRLGLQGDCGAAHGEQKNQLSEVES